MHTTAHWSDRYVGLDYIPGVFDCVDLCARVNREQFNREILTPNGRADGPRALARQILAVKDDVCVRVPAPLPGDAVLMRARGWLSHVGAFVQIGAVAYVLHGDHAAGQVVRERLAALTRRGYAIEGYYRWLLR